MGGLWFSKNKQTWKCVADGFKYFRSGVHEDHPATEEIMGASKSQVSTQTKIFKGCACTTNS